MHIGGLLGFAAGLLIIANVGEGFLRAKIGAAFRPLHRLGGILLLCAAAAHGTLLYRLVGFPSSAWHLCGTVAAGTAVAALAVGFSRTYWRRHFLALHKILAVSALLLAALHRTIPLF